jgi:thiosulfate dehydrogenase
MWKAIKTDGFMLLIFLVVIVVLLEELISYNSHSFTPSMVAGSRDSNWTAPSLYTDMELQGTDREMVMYGEDLIAHTARYLGPKGSVAQVTNGMNCQNCHLEAGTRLWGNNYSGVYSTYPKFRERSGNVESIYKRINDCIERSLNGKAMDSNSKELKAIYAYMKWLGQDVRRSVKPKGAGLEKLPFLDRAAMPDKGQIIYNNNCSRCHGMNGEGEILPGASEYTYPPLWGNNSYNDGAGLYRLSSFAGYVKNNMPFDKASHANTVLTNAEAWDVAAFVNAQPRPHKDQSADWPDIKKKPVDFAFGPFADSFSEHQHKFGPFAPIAKSREVKN